ncbi:hypothetical protein H6G65_07560 [Microcystis elabens FACHB-917]|nr:hypothetical protein [Microcystis elabens FACHB-917]
MRALAFLFSLMVGLAMAFLAPALAGGHEQAPPAMIATTYGMAVDQMVADDLPSGDLLAELGIDPAPVLDVAA